MVSLDKIREEMRNRLAIDKELHLVEVMADTIDEALADAAVQLDTKVSNLQYEVVEKAIYPARASFTLRETERIENIGRVKSMAKHLA